TVHVRQVTKFLSFLQSGFAAVYARFVDRLSADDSQSRLISKVLDAPESIVGVAQLIRTHMPAAYPIFIAHLSHEAHCVKLVERACSGRTDALIIFLSFAKTRLPVAY